MTSFHPINRVFSALSRNATTRVSLNSRFVPAALSCQPRRMFSAVHQHQQVLTKGDPSQVYQAGLRNTVFSNECNLSSDSQVIPIFRVMDYDGKLQSGWAPPFTPEECIERYQFMVRLSIWDMMMYNIQRQGQFSQISTIV